MPVRPAKGPKKKCDDLARKIVHHRPGGCVNCGSYDNPNAAHLIGRNYAHTRTDLANLVKLCASCHRRFHDHPDEWMTFLKEKIGLGEYDRLKSKAERGVRKKFLWDAELVKLKKIAASVGV